MIKPIMQEFHNAEISKLTANKTIPEFSSGDTIALKLKIGERTSNYEGICIARRNRGLGSSFTLEKSSFGEKVRRIFPLYHPNILEIKVLKRGQVRRAKLNYLRNRSSKEARIPEAKFGHKAKLMAKSSNKVSAKK